MKRLKQAIKQKEPSTATAAEATIETTKKFNEQDSLLAGSNSKSSSPTGAPTTVTTSGHLSSPPPTSTVQKALVESGSNNCVQIEATSLKNSDNINNSNCYCCMCSCCCENNNNQDPVSKTARNNNNNKCSHCCCYYCCGNCPISTANESSNNNCCEKLKRKPYLPSWTRTNINMSKSTRLLASYFIAELLGTFLLVVIGDGAIAAYVLTKREVDTFTACFAFGVGAMVATFTAAKISGAHINPAASLAFALDGKLNWRLVPIYICAQYLGGFLGALVLMVNYAEAIQALDGGTRSAFGSTNSTGHIFATYPGPWVSVWGSLLDQIIGTAILLFSLSAVTDKQNANLEERHQPIYIAFIIGITCVSFNPNCGAIFNPARDLAPRLLTATFGYPNVFQPTSGLYWLTAGVLGPHIGAIVGVFTYKLLIGSSLAKKEEYEFNNNNEHYHHHHHHQALTCVEHQKRTGHNHNHHHHQHHNNQQQQQHDQIVPMQTSKFGPTNTTTTTTATGTLNSDNVNYGTGMR